MNGLWLALVLRDVGVLSSWFPLKNCEIVRGGLEVFSRSHWSSLLIIVGYQSDGVYWFHWSSLTDLIVAHQPDGALVPVPLVPGCAVGDVDRREVVQVATVVFCPPMNFLSVSILFVILPSEHDGSVGVLFRSFVSVVLLSSGLLPLSFAVSFTS